MKYILFYSVFSIILFNNVYAGSKPSVKICKILEEAFSGRYNPEKLCDKYDGSFCSSMKTIGQAVCSANDGSF